MPFGGGGGGGVGAPKILRGGVGKGAPKGRKANSSRCVPQKCSKGQGSVRTVVHPSPVSAGDGGSQKGLHWLPALAAPPSRGGGVWKRGSNPPPPPGGGGGLFHFPRAQCLVPTLCGTQSDSDMPWAVSLHSSRHGDRCDLHGLYQCGVTCNGYAKGAACIFPFHM